LIFKFLLLRFLLPISAQTLPTADVAGVDAESKDGGEEKEHDDADEVLAKVPLAKVVAGHAKLHDDLLLGG
jgi:hypothetical protein